MHTSRAGPRWMCRSLPRLAMESESSNSHEHDEAKKELESYLNKRMRIGISDGRVIDGMFLCTDKDCNIVLGNCEEFLSQDEVDEYESSDKKSAKFLKQPRTLSLAIVPGEHIVSIALAMDQLIIPPSACTPPSDNTIAESQSA